jgi:hypothetical protein
MKGDCCRCWYSINHNHMVQRRLQFCLPDVSYLLKENINEFWTIHLTIFCAGEKDCEVQRTVHQPFSNKFNICLTVHH